MINEWKQVATRAWSFLLAAVGAAFLAAGAIWEYFSPEELGIPSWTYLLIASAISAATGGARLLKQEDLAKAIAAYLKDQAGAIGKRTAAVSVAAVMALAVPIAGKWEGIRTEAYRDVVGVWTVCYGETRGVKPGQSYSVAECKAMLELGLSQFRDGLLKCAPEMASAPASVQAAATSWSYNVGLGAACRSTLAKRLRSGDWRGACNELPKWKFAGGKVWKGLVNRRADERGLCLSGL